MKRGIQAGFGAPLGAETLDALKARGLEMVRLDLQYVIDGAVVRACIREVQDAGMTPLCIVAPERIDLVPADLGPLDLEVLNEPDLLGMVPFTYVAHVRYVYDCVVGRHRVWAGGVSNCTETKLRWLRLVVDALPEDVGVTLHRYPKNGEGPYAPQEGFKNRTLETHAIQRLVGSRRWGISECGYHTGPQVKGWWFWKRRWHWTDAQVAVFARQELAWWRAAGAAFAVWYQINDGVGTDPLDRFGIRRADGTWKPVAQVFAE